MLYPIDAYDKHGTLKPSKMLWLALTFSAKAWFVFVMAGASREQGAQILTIFYPYRDSLYIGMAMGLPAILLMWLSGQRYKNKKIMNILWQHGKKLLLAAYLTDCLLQLYHLSLTQGAFSWTRAIIMLLTLWFSVYLIRSTRVQNTFADKPVER